MHATTRQLIAIRDREPVDAGIRAHVDACDECRQALVQFRALRDALRELPEEVPPPGSWARIEAAWQQESTSRRIQPYWPWATAASLLVAVLLAWNLVSPEPSMPVVAGNGSSVEDRSVDAAADGNVSLANLQARSRYLEQVVGALRRDSGRVTSLSTAGAIGELEDSIAYIDYRLSAGAMEPLDDGERRQLWQQRIDLLESLVKVRYAQARTNSI